MLGILSIEQHRITQRLAHVANGSAESWHRAVAAVVARCSCAEDCCAQEARLHMDEQEPVAGTRHLTS